MPTTSPTSLVTTSCPPIPETPGILDHCHFPECTLLSYFYTCSSHCPEHSSLFCLVTMSSKSLIKCLLLQEAFPDSIHWDTFHQSPVQASVTALGTQSHICGFNLPHRIRNFSGKGPAPSLISLAYLAHWHINTKYLGICSLRSSITMLPNPRILWGRQEVETVTSTDGCEKCHSP